NLADQLGAARDRYQTLLDDVDRKFTPVCEMCSFDYTSALNTLPAGGNTPSLVNKAWQVRVWCNAMKKANGDCKTLSELQSAMTVEERAAYDEHYRTFVALREYVALYSAVKAKRGVLQGPSEAVEYDKELATHLEDMIQVTQSFNPVENITFSAGAEIGRSISSDRSTEVFDSYQSETHLQVGVGFQLKGNIDVFVVPLVSVASFTEAESEMLFSPHYTHTANLVERGTTTKSLTTGFVLNDDDDGDHFSTDVYYPFNGGVTTY
ncbi:MAG TPA: hypothetical protein DCR93_28905, partial [Cytophagales bacterium]|nr:hypothetical protein [Cytophagales bacterium]